MFSGLFGKKKSTPPLAQGEALAPAVTDAIYGVVGARSIPPMAGAAQKAFQLSTDPNAEARDFIEVIESDEGLSARVLKIANSVYFDRGKKSTTIEESVLVIGINELRCLLNSNTLSEIFPSKAQSRSFLWSHDIGTAIAARVIAQRVLPQKTEIAFLGGLMHDIGKLLLLQRVPDEYAKVLQRVESAGIVFCSAEAEVFPFDHTEVGQLIGERWNFSPELLAMIRLHHRPWDSLVSETEVTLPAVVKAADCMAHSLGLGHQRGLAKLKGFYERELAHALKALRIPAAEGETIISGVRRSFETEYDLYAGMGS